MNFISWTKIYVKQSVRDATISEYFMHHRVDCHMTMILPQRRLIHTHRGENHVKIPEMTEFYPNADGVLVMPKTTSVATQALSQRLST